MCELICVVGFNCNKNVVCFLLRSYLMLVEFGVSKIRAIGLEVICYRAAELEFSIQPFGTKISNAMVFLLGTISRGHIYFLQVHGPSCTLISPPNICHKLTMTFCSISLLWSVWHTSCTTKVKVDFGP